MTKRASVRARIIGVRMPDQILPADVADLLDTLPAAIAEQIKVLSLDCFDTLLWRSGHAPRDVFADLPIAGGGGSLAEWPPNRPVVDARLTRTT